MFRQLILLVLLFFLSGEIAMAQSQVQKDSGIYKRIEAYSNKRKFSKFVYGLFFKPVIAVLPVPAKKKIKQIQVQKPYSTFEGKIIRSIQISTLDPFGYSVKDTASIKQNIFYRAGNSMHVKSQRITIRNLLLFRRNEPFDSLLVRESERLIRTQKYVHEVSFYVVSAGADSVDIAIRELDIWSIIPSGAVSTSVFKINLTDGNFLGFGHEVQSSDAWYQADGNNAFNAAYFIPNVRNTYINTSLKYSIDEYDNFSRSFDVERPFFSPFAKWAAGVFVSQQFKKDSIRYHEAGYVPFDLKFNSYDYWAGSATQAFRGNTENARTTNLIAAVRFIQTNYIQKPDALYDSLQFFSNENFYIGAIGISARQYVQDKFVFNYGITEDVPAGKVYALTGGYQEKNGTGRVYLGGRFSIGNYYKLGYVSTSFEYGTFFRSADPEQGVFSAAINYFTGLFEFGKWKVRQFMKPIITYGIKRLPVEHLTINNENGIKGFSPDALYGTNKFILTLQTQSYCPWNVLGFRFGPYLIYSMGMLANAESGFKKSRVYSQFGIGLLIKNEYLVFNYFQVSVAFYPYIPEEGENIFKINPNSTADFGFRDFEIEKPGPALYQ
jgi:hypothetical protein